MVSVARPLLTECHAEPNRTPTAVPGVPLFFQRFASMSLVGDEKSCVHVDDVERNFSTSAFVQSAALSDELVW